MPILSRIPSQLTRGPLTLLCLLVALAPLASLAASSAGGGNRGGGGGSYRPLTPRGGNTGTTNQRTKVDEVYQLGARLYNGKSKPSGSFDRKRFDKQVYALEQASMKLKDDKKPDFYQFAGRLSDKDYSALQRFLRKRHRYTLGEQKSRADYASAALWLRKPSNEAAAGEADDATLRGQQLIFFHRLHDAVQDGSKDENSLQLPDLQSHAGQVSPELFEQLLDYAAIRLGLSKRKAKSAEAIAYERGYTVLQEADDHLLPEPDPETFSKQRSWLRKLERALPKEPELTPWAGRISEEDWDALRTYARVRYRLF